MVLSTQRTIHSKIILIQLEENLTDAKLSDIPDYQTVPIMS